MKNVPGPKSSSKVALFYVHSDLGILLTDPLLQSKFVGCKRLLQNLLARSNKSYQNVYIIFSVSGVSSVANIFEHMSRSRKVIVVLTRHFWNGMNEFELDQATTMYHEHDLDDIIVIKVGDVPPRRIPPHVYTQMRNDTFLEWEDDANALRTFKEKPIERLRNQNEHAN